MENIGRMMRNVLFFICVQSLHGFVVQFTEIWGLPRPVVRPNFATVKTGYRGGSGRVPLLPEQTKNTMFRYPLLLLLAILLLATLPARARDGQPCRLSGRVTDARTGEAVCGAAIVVGESRLWAISDHEGRYLIPGIADRQIELHVTCLGYVACTVPLSLGDGENTLDLTLREANLSIDEVVVTAQTRTETSGSSQVIDRRTIEHAQLININEIGSLLPGGKTAGDQNLTSGSSRIALHAGGGSEMGNASFGTAVELDGMRIGNNASTAETAGTDLRHIGVSNIESVEVITGIPSVEYGDLSNGIVKIRTRRGKTPFLVEMTVEPRTRQMAISKGFLLGRDGSERTGILNVNIERARSVSNLASPHTAYDRNNLNLTYSNTFRDRRDRPLRLTASVAGNLGGYNSEADPDEFKESYTRTRDYAARGNVQLEWLLDKPCISNLYVQATASYSDKLTETNENRNSASTQPYIHTTEAGYHIAERYDDNPAADIILSPTGYWYTLSRTDSKPLSYSFKVRADWNRRAGEAVSRLLLGSEVTGSGNLGRGLYYTDMRYAPTWREYRYDRLPFMHNAALFVEEQLTLPVTQRSLLRLSAGLRADATLIRSSEYGTVASLSPRLNAKYVLWENRRSFVSDLAVRIGWGKSVKQPSFQTLYPATSYSDRLAFAPGTTADGTTFYAYYTQPTTPARNPDLKWQYTVQQEAGIEATLGGTRLAVTLFRNRTVNPYMSRTIYTPFTYKLTTQADLEAGCTIPSADRIYTIDRETGIVTVLDRTGTQAPQTIGYRERNTFVAQTQYTNGSPVERWGVDFTADFAQINPLRTRIRLDGNYYRYKGLNLTEVASTLSSSASMADGSPYKYIGYYAGAAAVSNGSLKKQVNLNMTVITHIPRIRMIFSVRLETTLYDYGRNLSQYGDGSPRGYLLDSSSDYFGASVPLNDRGRYVAVYPEYYTTWEAPDERIPFAEKFAWARDNDPALYQELAKLVVKSNTSYYFDSERISASFAVNFNLTKEIGRFASITFYARNFLHNMGRVRSSQTGLESSLFGSSRIPQFYYGLSLRLKL